MILRTDKYIDGRRGVSFFCPGCQDFHAVPVEGRGWKWNGSMESPTLSPSISIKTGHYASGHKNGDACWCTYNAEYPSEPPSYVCRVCHSFVTDGHIRFLSDCTHDLSGQTVPLPDIDDVVL